MMMMVMVRRRPRPTLAVLATLCAAFFPRGAPLRRAPFILSLRRSGGAPAGGNDASQTLNTNATKDDGAQGPLSNPGGAGGSTEDAASIDPAAARNNETEPAEDPDEQPPDGNATSAVVNDDDAETSLSAAPPTWDELRDRVSRGELRFFSREPEVDEAYRTFRAKIDAEWWTFEDFLLWKIFEIDEQDEDGKLAAVRHYDTDPPRRLLRQNDFPYRLPSDVEHWVLWATRSDLVRRKSVEAFVRYCFQYHDVIAWVNPPDLRSVRWIPHAHVLLRKRYTDEIDALRAKGYVADDDADFPDYKPPAPTITPSEDDPVEVEVDPPHFVFWGKD